MKCPEGCNCAWWCPVHDTHHAVPSMVEDCVRSTEPDDNVRLIDSKAS